MSKPLCSANWSAPKEKLEEDTAPNLKPIGTNYSI